jgi:Heparinase II/III-like protein
MRSLPTRFEKGGYVILGESLHASEEFRVTVDCGPLGYNRIAGHGHADALAVQVSWGGVQMLVDPGTYCYNAAPDLRHFFRGTHAHNTLAVDDCDQSSYGASFLWLRDVTCTVISSDDSTNGKSIHATHDGYCRLADPVTHHRRVTLRDDGSLAVDDWIESTQPHGVELLWHAPVGATFVLESDGAWLLAVQDRVLRMSIEYPGPFETSVVEGRESPPQGWVSTRFYQRDPAPVLSARGMLSPHQTLRTVIERRSAR